MPSLLAFGKLLFELYLGKSVPWDQIDNKLEPAKGELFAKEILQAVGICTSLGPDKTLTQGGTIRDVE